MKKYKVIGGPLNGKTVDYLGKKAQIPEFNNKHNPAKHGGYPYDHPLHNYDGMGNPIFHNHIYELINNTYVWQGIEVPAPTSKTITVPSKEILDLAEKVSESLQSKSLGRKSTEEIKEWAEQLVGIEKTDYSRSEEMSNDSVEREKIDKILSKLFTGLRVSPPEYQDLIEYYNLKPSGWHKGSRGNPTTPFWSIIGVLNLLNLVCCDRCSSRHCRFVGGPFECGYAPEEASDKYCVTAPDGSCVSNDPRCMHQPPESAANKKSPHSTKLCRNESTEEYREVWAAVDRTADRAPVKARKVSPSVHKTAGGARYTKEEAKAGHEALERRETDEVDKKASAEVFRKHSRKVRMVEEEDYIAMKERIRFLEEENCDLEEGYIKARERVKELEENRDDWKLAYDRIKTLEDYLRKAHYEGWYKGHFTECHKDSREYWEQNDWEIFLSEHPRPKVPQHLFGMPLRENRNLKDEGEIKIGPSED